MKHIVIGQAFEVVSERAKIASIIDSGCEFHVNATVRRGVTLGEECITISYTISDRYVDGATVAVFINGQDKTI